MTAPCRLFLNDRLMRRSFLYDKCDIYARFAQKKERAEAVTATTRYFSCFIKRLRIMYYAAIT